MSYGNGGPWDGSGSWAPEDLEYDLDGLRRAPEETLHGLDWLWMAIRNEGDEAGSFDRRGGGDRRQGRDRRGIDLWRETGRPGLELRTGIDRRSGQDRRRSVRRQRVQVDVEWAAEIVTPWQIREHRPTGT